MIEMFRIVFVQMRGLNFHTKPAATTACDTFSLFPRTASFSTAHGLRKGILNPNIHISSTCDWVFTYHTHSSWHCPPQPPCTVQLHSDVFHGGVPLLENSISMAPEFQGHGLGCVSTPTVRLHHCSPNPLAACKRERTSWAKSLSTAGWGAGAEQEGETTGQTAGEGKEEEWDHRNSNNNSESHL